MFYYLFLALAIWIGWGVSLAIIKTFVYFRGPKHMVEVYKTHQLTKAHALRMEKNCNGRYGYIFVSLLMVCVFCPPLFTIDFYYDIVLFSWEPYCISKKKK